MEGYISYDRESQCMCIRDKETRKLITRLPEGKKFEWKCAKCGQWETVYFTKDADFWWNVTEIAEYYDCDGARTIEP